MGRPKKEKYEIEERFLTEALLLAGSYSDAVKEKKQLQDLMTGEFEYTEDMAIQDLIGGGQQEGERVQTSNISNIPERAAILLADGYVEKQKYRMQKEAQLLLRGIRAGPGDAAYFLKNGVLPSVLLR